MLTPAQVIPLLQHSDPEVVDRAVSYLATAHDQTPATAEDLWRAFDAKLNPPLRSWILEKMPEFPQTDSSVTRTLHELSEDHEVADLYHLLHTLQNVPIDILQSRRDEILAARMPEHVRVHLESRPSLLETAPDELWELLENQVQINDEEPSDDQRAADRLIEALARHPAFAAPKAMSVIEDDTRDDSFIDYCVKLLGSLRHAPAADPLIEIIYRVAEDDWEFAELLEIVGDALVRLAPADVIPKLLAFYPRGSEYAKTNVIDTLARFKTPESEDAIFRFLLTEDDSEIRAAAMHALAQLLTNRPDILDHLRQIVITGQYDPEMVDMEDDLLVLCDATGYNPPETAQWRESVSQRRAAADDDLSLETDELLDSGYSDWIRTGSLNPIEDEEENEPDEVEEWDWVADKNGGVPFSEEDDAEPLDEIDDAPLPPVTTFRRTEPKIGRNEPCPCGSGKKYKKCCGNGST